MDGGTDHYKYAVDPLLISPIQTKGMVSIHVCASYPPLHTTPPILPLVQMGLDLLKWYNKGKEFE